MEKLIKPTNSITTSGENTTADGISRRGLIRAGAGVVAGAVAAPAILRGRGAHAATTSLFTLGVASGDPRATSVVLWTRLAPDPVNGGGMPNAVVPVTWKIATDETMVNVIAGGTVDADPATGHTVHVLVRGLPSSTWLYYQFEAMGESSRIGRTRTFPRPGEAAPRMRFALVSCQNYEQGYYPAWRHIADWRDRDGDDLDFVVHVGDYIYEGAPRSTELFPGQRRHSGTTECFTVEDYRNRYAQYKLDHFLQNAHANFPFIVTPDDHEVEDNYAGLTPEEGAELVGADFAQRRRFAYQVYGETMPLRAINRTLNGKGNLQLYRRLNFGTLADIHVLDTRQFRTNQPAADGFGSTDPDSVKLEPFLGEKLYDADGILDPDATMMGATQEQWLADGLAASTATWNIIAQQVMMMRWNLITTARLSLQYASIPEPYKTQALQDSLLVDDMFNVDAWDGYQAARQRLFNVLDTVRPNNPVVLSGDIHSAWAANLLKDFSDPTSDMLAAELVCTSIASTFLSYDPRSTHAIVKAGLVDNPHIAYFNGLFRGYTLCDATPNRMLAHFIRVGDPTLLFNPDPYALVPREGMIVENDATFRIQPGFNTPGSGARIETRHTTPLPSPF